MIKKFSQYNENFQDTPEEYIKTALMKIKNKIDGFFEKEPERDPNEVISMSQAIEQGKKKSKKDKNMSLPDMGLSIESSELSKYSALYDNVTFKFSDPEFWYNLYITIPLNYIEMDKESDFSDTDIEECSIKFKKYNYENNIIGQLGPRKVKIEDIDETFLVDLKIELDEDFPSEEEEFEIET